MFISVGDIVCEYEKFDGRRSKDTVVFLHGWGGGLKSFSGAYKAVCDWGVSAVNLAFPTEVPVDWGIYDYAAYVKSVLDMLKVDKPILVGHSFGGRVAIILAAQGLCKKLVLTAAAGMKPKFSLAKSVRIAKYRARKKKGKPLDGFGSIDYNNCKSEMRGVFVRVVNTYLEKLLPYIECETLLFWGRADRDTPPYMAKRLKRSIKNSRLVFTDGGHFAYIDAGLEFTDELKSFILRSSD